MIDLIELLPNSTIDHTECKKLSSVSIEIGIEICYIQIQYFLFVFLVVLHILVRNHHEINSVEFLWFPLDVSVIGRSNDIFFLLVVENEAIVLMFHCLHVAVEHEINRVELSVGKAEEIFQLD